MVLIAYTSHSGEQPICGRYRCSSSTNSHHGCGLVPHCTHSECCIPTEPRLLTSEYQVLVTEPRVLPHLAGVCAYGQQQSRILAHLTSILPHLAGVCAYGQQQSRMLGLVAK